MNLGLNNVYINYSNKIILIILFIINMIFLSYKGHKFQSKLKKSNRSIKPVINNYQLINKSDEIFFSLLLDFSDKNFNLTSEDLINILPNLYNQTFQEVQIILMNNSSNYNLTNKFIKERKIEIYSAISKIWWENFIDLIHRIKGKFIILISDIIIFESDELFKLYNKTKGSTDYIFQINHKNNVTFYLLRTKIIKDIIDSEKTFENYNKLINYIHKIPLQKFNYVPIAYCPNNYYTALTYTSMLSILINKLPYTYILFYIVITNEFSKKNIEFIEKLYEQFEYFNITFITMDNRYKNAYTRRYLSKNAFFRFSLGELLPDLNKLIYLDSDTICLKDLSSLYNLNFNGKIFLARIISYEDNKKYNFTVNTGILLLNLKKMRIKKIEKEVLNLLNSGFSDPNFHDQAIINKFYKKYVGFLSPIYNKCFISLDIFYKKTRKLYDFDSIYFFNKFPAIIHYPGSPEFKTYNDENWYYFARKSKYFRKRSHNYTNIFNFSL